MFDFKVSIVTVLLCSPSLAASSPQLSTPLPGYRYEVLWNPSNAQTLGYGINERGDVVGSSRHPGGAPTATLWRDAVPRQLGLFGSNVTIGIGINSGGVVVGQAAQGPLGSRTFLWRAGTHEILTVNGFDQTSLGSITESGLIVGAVRVNGPFRAARWNGSSQGELIPLPGVTPSLAFGVNDSGGVVGLWYTPSGEERGFVYANGAVTIVQPLMGHNHATLYDINNSGVAVGHSNVLKAAGAGPSEAILVSNGVTHVIPVPVAGGEKTAWKINDRGQVLGTSSWRGPFIHQDGETWFLSDLPGLPEWDVIWVGGINNRGQIVGSRHDGTTFKAFVLTPCLGNLNRDAVIDFDDLDLFYRAYHTGNRLADVDENGTVDLVDEQVFLQAWANGC